ncbi:zinc-iron permease family [Plasmopara halstedii]|uniref:Zinc-iron permease family n=1 Tax=Plasmopara halstedii TaxID=4781 RepID=A0A0P1AF82_PLAHL|nr:zinc-iron permease family [Plasmopara halstedii]CEG39073.1 zinc-iron permease family [Plasmopara halstedii]|eukprot:XP_024575442.1 zinc-iron permease family [Plasmopara halstedii]
MNDVTLFKLVSIVCIWIVGLVGGLVPACLASRHEKSPAMGYLNAFSGGVFLAGGFFHLLHSAIENPALCKWSTEEEGRYEFPYAEMFCTLGFLGLLLLEQAAQATMDANDKVIEYMPTQCENDDEIRGATESDDTYVEDLDEEKQTLRSGSSEFLSFSAPKKAEKGSKAVALVLFIALSFHSVLEGLGIGAQKETAWGVFLAIIMHKGLAAFALGSGLIQSAMPVIHVTIYMVVFSFMSIIGIIVGWIIAADSSEDSAAAGICVALASGTFIYVAVMEVIPHEFPQHSHGRSEDHTYEHHKSKETLRKSVALVAGYAIFGLLAKWS